MLIGVVGKPSVGKSTFFKAATLAEAEIANYPFTTIKPNSGVGFVRVDCVDKDLGRQCNPRTGYCSKGIRFIPVQLLDVAGLVPGAHEGKGMGNQFLDDLRQADVLIHVIDAAGATNEKGESQYHHTGCGDDFVWDKHRIYRGWSVYEVSATNKNIESEKYSQC